MTTASRRAEQLMTVAEFLLWRAEVTDDARYELVHGLPVRLTAPTNLRHGQIQYNTGQALRQAIAAEGLPRRVYDVGPGVAVGIEGDECGLPDVVGTCAGEIDETAHLVPEPLIVVEVASRSTRLADVNDKVEFYSTTASIQAFPGGRAGSASGGVLWPRAGRRAGAALRQGSITLEPPGISLALAALYQDTAPAEHA